MCSFVSGIFGPALFVGLIPVTVCSYRLSVLIVWCSLVSRDHHLWWKDIWIVSSFWLLQIGLDRAVTDILVCDFW